MTEKIYLLILRTGIISSLLSVFLVYKSLLFPYITSKQITFNILIEVLLVFWLAFIVKFPAYRPKWSYISFGLIAFFFAMILSSITGVDFNLSFWGDVERMLGVFHLLHFLAFYFIVITVMRRWEDWKIFLIVSTVFAAIVSLMGIGEGSKAYTTIGNTAYVSGYLIFNIYFCFLLFFKERNKSLRWLYLLPLIIYYFEFNKANTTGALVGLGFSIIVLFFLYGILAKNKKIKLATLSLFLFLSVFSFLALSNKDSDFIKNNSLLSPIRGIDIEKNTFQTRLISWKAAWLDFKEHPILGVGHGNYAIVFDKYFDPVFYNYTRSETYFDRAHNNVVDIASTSGLVGLLTYLSIFVALAYYLIRGYIKKYFGVHEFVIISSLIVAYFVQNLAVFDSLVTYMGLMMTLGLVYFLYQDGEESVLDDIKEKGGEVKRKMIGEEQLKLREIYTLLASAFVLFIIMWQFNITPLKMLVTTINGQKAYAQKNIVATIDTYREALSYDTVLDRDSRTSLIRVFATNPAAFNQIPEDKRLSTVEFLIELAEANVDYNTGDSLNQMMLAQVLDTASKVVSKDASKAMYYSDRAIEAINKSIEASPRRVPIYFQKAQIQLSRQDQDGAIATLKQAYDLNPDYYDSACHLGKSLLFQGKNDEAYKYIGECIDKNGARLLAPAGQIKKFITYYEEQEDGAKVISLYEALINIEKNNINNMVALAKLYAENGQTEKAIELAMKISETDPTTKSYVGDFIESLSK